MEVIFFKFKIVFNRIWIWVCVSNHKFIKFWWRFGFPCERLHKLCIIRKYIWFITCSYCIIGLKLDTSLKIKLNTDVYVRKVLNRFFNTLSILISGWSLFHWSRPSNSILPIYIFHINVICKSNHEL